jgi:hypothetical protein
MNSQEAQELVRTHYPIFYLSEEEVADPLSVITSFFSFAHLPEVKEMLWLSLKTNVTGSFPHGDTLNPRDRYDIVLLYEQLTRLVEAAHLLNEKRILDNVKNHFQEQ